MGNIRIPVKKTSIQKKEKIVKVGFELMCEKGYHNVNTVDIAKEAGVSTGIIYQYFNDKRDIFIEGIRDYSDKIMFPMFSVIDNKKADKDNFELVLSEMIDKFIKTHTMKKEAHEELMAMGCLDSEIGTFFKDMEFTVTQKISKILVDSGFESNYIEEKVHILVNLVDNYCHEVVYHKHKELNYEIMKQEIIKIAKYMI